MRVADAQQRLNVRIVRVLAERIDKEEDRRDFALGHARGNLGISADGPDSMRSTSRLQESLSRRPVVLVATSR